jgi:hypothetical protein
MLDEAKNEFSTARAASCTPGHREIKSLPLTYDRSKGAPFCSIVGLFVLLLVITSGCGSLYDKVPPGSPKGYVEFYGDVTAVSDFKIYEDIGGATEWRPSPHIKRSVNGQPYSCRIAGAPGQHCFVVESGSFKERTTVNVQEGMITPVWIQYQQADLRFSGNLKTTSFRANLVPETPIPIPTESKP